MRYKCLRCGKNPQRLSFSQLGCFMCRMKRAAYPDAVLNTLSGLALVAVFSVCTYFLYRGFAWISEQRATQRQDTLAWISNMNMAGCKVTSFVSRSKQLYEVWTCPGGEAIVGRRL